MGVAELDEARAFRVAGETALETDRPHFVGAALAGTHTSSVGLTLLEHDPEKWEPVFGIMLQ